jgi:hypothetical protein
MAVPSSGSLSLRRIAAEKVFDNYNVTLDGFAQGILGTTSLADVSTSGNSNGSTPSFDSTNTNNPSADRPDGSQPHSMSEFYSYDHDYADFSSTLTVGTAFIINANYYGYSSSAYGSMSNTSFNNGTITSLYWRSTSGGELFFNNGQKLFSSITINGNNFPASTNWTLIGGAWRYITTTNPFGTTANVNISVTANY